MKILKIVLSLIILSSNCYAQKAKQERELIAYNIGFGIVSTSIGALINKPKGQNAWDCIKKSAWQGAVGGSLQYAGKKLTYQINKNENYWWGLPSKLVHSAGASICQNAAMGNDFGKYWFLDYGAVRLNLSLNEGKVDIQPQLNLLFAYDLYYGLGKGKVDWSKSFQTGTVIFSAEKDIFRFSNGLSAVGYTYTRSIMYANLYDGNKHELMAHELVHIYQTNEYRVMNTYFNPITAKIKNKGVNDFLKYVYVEIPFHYGFYGLNFQKERYFKNIYEFEAKFFSTDKYVDRSEIVFTNE